MYVVEEVAEGKIPEACNIPLGLLEFRMHELNKIRNILSFVVQAGEVQKLFNF